MFSPSRVVARLTTYFQTDSSSPTRQEMAIADAFRGILQRAMYADIDYEDDEETYMVIL